MDAPSVAALATVAPLKTDGPDFGRRRGARRLLAWLASFPGQDWQQRWEASGAEQSGRGWLGQVVDWTVARERTGARNVRAELLIGTPIVIGSGAVRPGYDWLLRQHAPAVLHAARLCMDPDGFARVDETCRADPAISTTMRQWVLRRLTWIVIAKGGTIADVTVGDFLELHEAERAIRKDAPAATLTYRILCDLEILPATAPASLRAAFTPGPRSVAELVDQYQLACRPIRDLLVDYLSERAQAMDYTTRCQRAIYLVKLFWADLERHHPGIDSLHLTSEVAAAWKERLHHVRDKRGTVVRERLGKADVLITVRAFYLDLAQWAVEEPTRWGPWVAPCPIGAGETNTRKRDALRKSRMDQRTRERLPVVPALVRAAERRITQTTRLLDAARATAPGDTFTVDGTTFRRPGSDKGGAGVRLWAVETDTGRRRDVISEEEYAFWAWAAVEVLRHTGVRIEELLELTHHSFVTYKLPDTGEIVPLLQITPSKLDKERLLLVTPELGEVLTAVIHRVRAGEAALPLVSAYHTADQTWSAPMPYLFQRPRGHEHRAIAYITIRTMLDDLIHAAGLTGGDGKPLRFVPHDFRRIFITDAILHGLPPHIAQVLAGHDRLETTIGYKAIYPVEAINTYRAFVARRRNTRPSHEYRDVTPEEWDEFLGHFAKRKVSIGDCAREYGTSCQHEHSCIRCPMLRPDPTQKDRLAAIRTNLIDRIAEARNQGWLGEVEGLEATLAAADQKLEIMETIASKKTIHLGMPTAGSADR